MLVVDSKDCVGDGESRVELAVSMLHLGENGTASGCVPEWNVSQLIDIIEGVTDWEKAFAVRQDDGVFLFLINSIFHQ